MNGKGAPRERPYDEQLRSQLKELYPRQHRKVAMQVAATEDMAGEAADYGHGRQGPGPRKILSSQASPTSRALGQRVHGFTAAMDFKKGQPAEPVDAYSDLQNAQTVAHSDLEEILAIPKDGRKLLLQHSLDQQKEGGKSRNSMLKKLAAASTYSLGGQALSSHKELQAMSATAYRTASAAQLSNQSPGLRALHAASAHQLQRLQVARTTKELDRSQAGSHQRLSVLKSGPLAKSPGTSAKKSLPQLKGQLSAGHGLGLLAQSKSSQVQQCASQKLQKKLESSKLERRADQSPRVKGF